MLGPSTKTHIPMEASSTKHPVPRLSWGRFIREIFPHSRVILTRRTGIEVVESVQRKFDMKFEDACQLWNACMKSTSTVRASVTDLLEIDQFDMTNSAREVATKVSEYLGQPQKGESLAEFFLERRTDQRSRHSWNTRLTLAGSAWSESAKQFFISTCGEQMTRFGYPV